MVQLHSIDHRYLFCTQTRKVQCGRKTERKFHRSCNSSLRDALRIIHYNLQDRHHEHCGTGDPEHMDHPCSIGHPVASAGERDSNVLDEVQERSRACSQGKKDHIPHPRGNSPDPHTLPRKTHSLRCLHHLHHIYNDESDPQSDSQIK